MWCLSRQTGNVFRAAPQQCHKAPHLLVSSGQLPFILCQRAPWSDYSSYLEPRQNMMSVPLEESINKGGNAIWANNSTFICIYTKVCHHPLCSCLRTQELIMWHFGIVHSWKCSCGIEIIPLHPFLSFLGTELLIVFISQSLLFNVNVTIS